jgi:hypothetical protein
VHGVDTGCPPYWSWRIPVGVKAIAIAAILRVRPRLHALRNKGGPDTVGKGVPPHLG